MNAHGKVLSSLAAFCGLLLSTQVVFAQSFNFTFTDGSSNVVATGSFDVSGGVVTNGSATVNSIDGFLNVGAFSNLGAPPSFRVLGGHDLIIDNLFSASDPHFDGDGVGFGSGPTGGFPQYQYGVNLWGNGGGSYTLYEAGQLPDASAPVYRIMNGSLSLTAIPEPATYAAILGLVTLGVAAFRRRLQGEVSV